MSIINQIKQIFTKEEIGKLKSAFNEVEPTKIALMTAKLVDGTEINYEGELAVGSMVMVGDVSAPDGSHEIEDGTKITIANGYVTEIEKVEETVEVAAMTAEEVTLAISNAVIETEKKFSKKIAEFETKLLRANENFKGVFSLIEKLGNIEEVSTTPTQDPKGIARQAKQEKLQSISNAINNLKK
jgi:hypothetical protein